MTPTPNLFLRSAAFVHSLIFPSKLPHYLHTPGSSWALVIGSTSGVGLALASELCSRGFNVILHGRNQAKLEGVRSKLLTEFSSRQIEIVLLDAAICFSGENYENSRGVILKATNGRDVSLVINNVSIELLSSYSHETSCLGYGKILSWLLFSSLLIIRY
jgi:NAD(P)-dependent dehydrogenase (short-subunit alcohol dehydrogenase family)